MIFNFSIRFSTKYGQALFVSGTHTALGNNDFNKALPLQYLNEEFWQGSIEIPSSDYNLPDLHYCYILEDIDGIQIVEWGNDRVIQLDALTGEELILVDTWNHAGEIENSFFTKAFQDVLFRTSKTSTAIEPFHQKFTHEFRVKAPTVIGDEVLCIGGTGIQLGDWQTDQLHHLTKQGSWWTIQLDLSNSIFPISYKYGVYNTKEKKFQGFESGTNRVLKGENRKLTTTILHDGFAQLGFPKWRGAGVSIPVFSLRSEKGFGTGEFSDIAPLVDWAKKCGLKLIQLLPINDTTATHSFLDSYPYAAISTFALHPLYINLEKVAGSKSNSIIKSLYKNKAQLNHSLEVDYNRVMHLKFAALKELFTSQKQAFFGDIHFVEFFDLNRHWLVPYAAFCYLRDQYETADFSQWKSHSTFNHAAVQLLASPDQPHYEGIAIHYFIQYHLHLQLKEVTAYAHKNGIVIKGDLPIGIYRYGSDAWMAPALFHMDVQAGAPPDDFAVKGQNWGFPTYNWKKMQEDDFTWWRKRFEQMSEYFDAFRIDHILGFFRIWSIPLHAVEGIMGKFVPAIPIHLNELYQQGISFQYQRYCKPYIPDYLVNEKFGNQADFVKANFLVWGDDSFKLLPVFDTQRKVESHFQKLPQTAENLLLMTGLYDLISNVIFFEEDGSQIQQFHFRIHVDQTISFRDLDEYSKQKLKQLYVNYFFYRQDEFWRKEAMFKLPKLKRSTNMLVCGEDLGMVPTCVPEVMRQLGILSLEIQRMPKQSNEEFLHPKDAPYLSVITPSTHDMSTIRGWWEENPEKTQHFYNSVLGHKGIAPFYCEPAINKEILIQHLQSPAMWCVFQIQDILGMDANLRRANPTDERINIPADAKHYWNYRMHLRLEDLILDKGFIDQLHTIVSQSGR